MGRRSNKSGESGMDMMSCLIGCLILILIGILVIIMVSQALIIVANPDAQTIRAIILSKIDAIKEDKAFPHGNKEKEPTYIDVHRDRLVIYPGSVEVSVRELEEPGNNFEKVLSTIEQHKTDEYIILMVRPRAAAVARRLRKIISEEKLIDLGMELVESKASIEYADSETRDRMDQAREAARAEKEKELETLGESPLPEPATP